MGHKSQSTLDRDQRRATDHKAYLLIGELNTLDWKSVEAYEIAEYEDLLNELIDLCENETLCDQLQYLLETIQDC